MTANHVEHEIGTFPGSPGRGGLDSPVGHPSRIETIPAENVRRFSAAVVPRPEDRIGPRFRLPSVDRRHPSSVGMGMPAPSCLPQRHSGSL